MERIKEDRPITIRDDQVNTSKSIAEIVSVSLLPSVISTIENRQLYPSKHTILNLCIVVGIFALDLLTNEIDLPLPFTLPRMLQLLST